MLFRSKRWVESDHAQALGGAPGEPARDPRVARVVDHDRFEICLALGEDGEQPTLGVGAPSMNHGEQGDRAWHSLRRWAGPGFDRLQLTPRGGVDDIPPARTKPIADGVGAFEIPVPPALHALGNQA